MAIFSWAMSTWKRAGEPVWSGKPPTHQFKVKKKKKSGVDSSVLCVSAPMLVCGGSKRSKAFVSISALDFLVLCPHHSSRKGIYEFFKMLNQNRFTQANILYFLNKHQQPAGWGGAERHGEAQEAGIWHSFATNLLTGDIWHFIKRSSWKGMTVLLASFTPQLLITITCQLK